MIDLPMLDDGQPDCDRCGGVGDPEPHTCPYQEEINGDWESLCHCCSDCCGDCAMDI